MHTTSKFYPKYHLEPFTPDLLTKENYPEVIAWLHNEQMMHVATQMAQAAWHGWGDDDFDYMTTALAATGMLMDIAYDGDLHSLRRFLYDDRDEWDQSLHAIDSAGGLCSPLTLISQWVDERFEAGQEEPANPTRKHVEPRKED